MATLINLLRELRRVGGNISLHTPVPISQLEVANNYSVPIWRGDGDFRDEWRFLLALQNRSPYQMGLEAFHLAALGVEYKFNGTMAVGLGWAHLCDGIALSFDLGAIWNAPMLALDRETLVEQANGHLQINADRVIVRHTSSVGHVAEHLEWLQAPIPVQTTGGTDLWTRRAELFPSLRFLPRVEKQITSLVSNTEQLGAVVERLDELNQAIAEWDVSKGDGPQYRSKVTVEHENRRKLCIFADSEGHTACYDLHARFTPGAGRIHFLLLPAEHVGVVGHVGDKL